MQRVATLLQSIRGNRRASLYLFFILVSPIIFYNLFSSIVIPDTPTYLERGWIIYNDSTYVLRQTLSVVILFVMINGTLLFWKYRVPVAMVGVASLLFGGFVDLGLLVEYMNIPVILFLLCMMVVVSYVRYLGFFDFFLEKTLLATSFEPKILMVFFVLMSALMSALVDEVSSILFISLLIFDLAKRFDIDPVPYLMCSIFATNIGSSATVLGNPVGIYVAFYANLSFDDFLIWSAPAAILATLVILPIMFRRHAAFLSLFRDKLSSKQMDVEVPRLTKRARDGGIIFTVTIVLLALHHTIESMFSLPTNSLLIAFPLAMASLALFSQKERAATFFEESVEWWTLVYFMFLFSISSTLEFTGVTAKISVLFISLYEILSAFITPLFLIMIFFMICTIVIGLLSSVIDNIVAVSIFTPIVSEIIKLNLPFSGILWWSVLIGGCYFGNASPVGSTANIVVLGFLDKRSSVSLSFRKWIGIGLLISMLTSIVASMYVFSVTLLGG
ncbi:MAG: SLC13 family permease [Nitrososphaeria archaeon]